MPRIHDVHFFVDQFPKETAEILLDFLKR